MTTLFHEISKKCELPKGFLQNDFEWLFKQELEIVERLVDICQRQHIFLETYLKGRKVIRRTHGPDGFTVYSTCFSGTDDSSVDFSFRLLSSTLEHKEEPKIIVNNSFESSSEFETIMEELMKILVKEDMYWGNVLFMLSKVLPDSLPPKVVSSYNNILYCPLLQTKDNRCSIQLTTSQEDYLEQKMPDIALFLNEPLTCKRTHHEIKVSKFCRLLTKTFPPITGCVKEPANVLGPYGNLVKEYLPVYSRSVARELGMLYIPDCQESVLRVLEDTNIVDTVGIGA